MAAKEDETFFEKLTRKVSKEPLVPLGSLVTVWFLGQGLKAFHSGNKQRAQTLMRGRVIAQGVTVVALGIGGYFGMKPHDRPKTMEEKMGDMQK